MNILFLSIGKLESINDRGIYIDLVRKFRDEGCLVTVVCPVERSVGLPTQFYQEEGVNFLKIKTGNITKTNIIEKGLTTLTIESVFMANINKYLDDINFDLVIYSSPPTTFEKIVNKIKKRDGALSYLMLKDIFPQNAVDLNMFSTKSIFYHYFKFKEKRLYNCSDVIGCMSPANLKYLLKHNPNMPCDKVEIFPNTIDPITIIKSSDMISEVRRKHNIPIDKIVYIYGGNLGKPQGIDFLIDCIKSNINNDKIYFLIVGNGTEYSKLQNFFTSCNPQNAQLISYLPTMEYENLVNTCDVGLIFLDKDFTIPNFPQRILSYMQASMPVLVATDVNTDMREIVENGKFGYWCESRIVSEFNEILLKFDDFNKRVEMGRNARKYLEENYTTSHSYKIIKKHFDKMK